MKNNRTFAKIAEIFFASGIPVLALADGAKGKENFLSSLPLLFLIIFTGGWHVKTFNDDCEDGSRLSVGSFVPLLLLPLVLFIKPTAGVILILIVVNWNLYALFGKNNFLSSMLHNSLGGFLHFVLGLAAAGMGLTEILGPKPFFFAFAMLCGSMHHDAYHTEEDKEKSYTGAVKFGADYWWKLAVFPMTFSIFFLAHCDEYFFRCFFYFALLPYFTGYSIISVFSEYPHKIFIFRPFCRIIFGISALLYILELISKPQ